MVRRTSRRSSSAWFRRAVYRVPAWVQERVARRRDSADFAGVPALAKPCMPHALEKALLFALGAASPRAQ
jgi:hypothetical protein